LWVDAFVREKRVGVIGPVGQVIGIVGEGRARKWKVKFNNDDVMFLSARSLALATGPSTSSTLLHEETQLIPSLDNDDVGSEEGERSNEDGSDLAGSSDDEDDSMQSLSAAEDAPSEEEPSENSSSSSTASPSSSEADDTVVATVHGVYWRNCRSCRGGAPPHF